METRQMGTWGEEGEKERGRGLERMRTELRWVRLDGRLVTGERKSWSAGWTGVVGRICCVCARD